MSVKSLLNKLTPGLDVSGIFIGKDRRQGVFAEIHNSCRSYMTERYKDCNLHFQSLA